jgi:hypothetical protein
MLSIGDIMVPAELLSEGQHFVFKLIHKGRGGVDECGDFLMILITLERVHFSSSWLAVPKSLGNL